MQDFCHHDDRAAEEAEKQREQTERDKAERARHRRDEAFWKTLLTDANASDDPAHKVALYESFLHDPDFRNHHDEAEEAVEEMQAELDAAFRRQAALEAARRKREDAEHQQLEAEAADNKRREEEAARKKREAAAAEKKRQAEAEAARTTGLPDMVRVQGGTFQMGQKGVAEPVHTVTLPDFEIGKYPVTQKLWQEVMGANPSRFNGCADCPVESVSWNDVQVFLEKLNTKFPVKKYRLPTEAEWEYAARGGKWSKGYEYAGSNNVDKVAWYDKNTGSKTHPVGGLKANELGLHDMSGNVWEWCSDWYGVYPSDSQNNPTGPTAGSSRVWRGGSWISIPRSCRVASRDSHGPTDRLSFGFRLAASPSSSVVGGL
ncbi:MAG: SUMF1/EgtB/PvdO family nonheme iron enzyme [Saprospiraceae bacterium]